LLINSDHATIEHMARDDPNKLNSQEILAAYALGYFPMARSRDDKSVVWVLPEIRGILPLDRAKAPKKLKRFARKLPFELKIDHAFEEVITSCAQAQPDRPDTWINDEIIDAYCDLHHIGKAHSVECYKDGILVGGLYGVLIGSIFCGESMFSRETNASKIAMLHLIETLQDAKIDLLDTQFYTDHLSQFGVLECENASYQLALRLYKNKERHFLGKHRI